MLCYKQNIPFISMNSYNMRISEFEFISCGVRRKGADILFIYDLLKGHISPPPPDLMSMIGLNIINSQNLLQRSRRYCECRCTYIKLYYNIIEVRIGTYNIVSVEVDGRIHRP